MNYVFMPSLKHMALIRTAIMLWNEDDIRALTTKFLAWPFRSQEKRREWQVIEDKVQEKVPLLIVPEELKIEILKFITPIGQEILKWRRYHEYFLCERRFMRRYLNRLCWTPQGTVDRMKTAEVLIKDEDLDVPRRYSLACIYSLENDVPNLWNQMPENHKKAFYNEEDPGKVDRQELVVVWTYYMKGELAKMEKYIEKRCQTKCSLFAYAFECAVHDGIKSTAEYFLRKLTPTEREDLLVTSAGVAARRFFYWDTHHPDIPRGCYADVLCFILSQMNEKQQTEIFQRGHREVLKCLLDWPWQGLFMEMAIRMSESLPGIDCNYILREISEKLIKGDKDYDYRQLFREFWRQIPTNNKAFIVEECDIESLLSKLLAVGDVASVQLIVNDANVQERELSLLKLGTMNLE